MTRRIWSIDSRSGTVSATRRAARVREWRTSVCVREDLPGERPPWQQKIFSSMTAATGRQLKQSVKVFHSLTL
jgi:hypothetical protein